MTGQALDRSDYSGLLSQPHHDGSALYVSNACPAPGETVQVLVRVPHEAGITAVHLRTAPDGEQQFSDALVDRRTDTDTWWRADLTCHNPVTSYRFILEGGPSSYAWLNGTGMHVRDVPDAADFRLVTYDAPPAWALDAVVYQIFPDRFAKAVDREAPEWADPAGWDDPITTERSRIAQHL